MLALFTIVGLDQADHDSDAEGHDKHQRDDRDELLVHHGGGSYRVSDSALTGIFSSVSRSRSFVAGRPRVVR